LCYVAKQFQLQSSTDIGTLSVREKIKRWRKEFEALQPRKNRVRQARGLRKKIKEWLIVLRLEKISKWTPARTLGNFILNLLNKKE